MLERLKERLTGEDCKLSLLEEMLQTIEDRVKIRLGTSTVPKVFESVVVDATVKMHRRMYYEGIKSESAEISTAFVEDILSEYKDEFEEYLSSAEYDGTNTKVVHFL